jgi:subtilisin-like proprotein convertase family protein
MKPIILFSVFLLLSMSGVAQSFPAVHNIPVQDNQTAVAPVVVSGLPDSMNSQFGLRSVTIHVNHTYDSQLDIFLVSPAMDTVFLVNNRGDAGDNFYNTYFSMVGTHSVIDGIAPFNGLYLPENSLNLFHNGSNPNGTWLLCVRDEMPGESGVILFVTLYFGYPLPEPPPSGYCSLENGLACQCPDGSTDCDLLPDMIASAHIISQFHTEEPGRLTLANATPNVGWGPMEIIGTNSCWCDTMEVSCGMTTCPDGSEPKQKILQRIYHKNGADITWRYEENDARMEFHPTHGHMHVDDWAAFTLRKPTSDPNPTHWPIQGTGTKMSFCLANVASCFSQSGMCVDSLGNNLTMDDMPNYSFGEASGCHNEQGISVGMLDYYGQGTYGMEIDLTGVCNGEYYLVSETDPNNNFIESDETNNWVAIPITISMQSDPLIAGDFHWEAYDKSVGFSPIGDSGVLSFIWDFGDGTRDSTSLFPIHDYVREGSYEVSLIRNGGCNSDTTTKTITLPLTSDPLYFLSVGFKAFPNPVNDHVTLSFMLPIPTHVEIELLNSLTQTISVIDLGEKETGNHEVSLSFPSDSFAPGPYIIKLNTDFGSTGTMLIKHN